AENYTLHRFEDYVEVARGDWLPTIHVVAQQGEDGVATDRLRLRLRKATVNEPLPDKLFGGIIPEGAHVHETLGGATRDYIQTAERSEAESDEIRANAARSKVYGPPPLDPSKGIL